MRLCQGSHEAAAPAFIERGFCPVCHVAVPVNQYGDTKRHYPLGVRQRTRKGVPNKKIGVRAK